MMILFKLQTLFFRLGKVVLKLILGFQVTLVLEQAAPVPVWRAEATDGQAPQTARQLILEE